MRRLYELHSLPVSIGLPDCMFRALWKGNKVSKVSKKLSLTNCNRPCHFFGQISKVRYNLSRAVATGVYRDIYPQNQSTLIFMWLFCLLAMNICTHPNQIPGYATEFELYFSSLFHCALHSLYTKMFYTLVDALTVAIEHHTLIHLV